MDRDGWRWMEGCLYGMISFHNRQIQYVYMYTVRWLQLQRAVYHPYLARNFNIRYL